MKEKPLNYDQDEIQRFSKLADQWWDLNGPFKALHQMNIERIDFMKKNISQLMNRSSDDIFNNLKILDAGCGGGILTEALHKIGADITGIDATKESISIAKAHAQSQGLHIDYRHGFLDDLPKEFHHSFDVVCSFEVIEHVPDVDQFIQSLSQFVRPNGLIFLSTINRNLISILLAKYAAEYILKLVAPETHDWKKFVRPSEIHQSLQKINFEIKDLQGLALNPISQKWRKSKNVQINYMACAMASSSA